MVHNDAKAVRLLFGVGVVHHDGNRADARVEAMREVGAGQSLGRMRDQPNDLVAHAPAFGQVRIANELRQQGICIAGWPAPRMATARLRDHGQAAQSVGSEERIQRTSGSGR
jgi:hypothetical protein